MGLGYNHDDGLSYGSSLEAVFSSSFTLSLVTGGYTDRLDTMQRYDVTALVASYQLQHQLFTFIPRLGLVASGNLAFDEAQNFFYIVLLVAIPSTSPTPQMRVPYTL